MTARLIGPSRLLGVLLLLVLAAHATPARAQGFTSEKGLPVNHGDYLQVSVCLDPDCTIPVKAWLEPRNKPVAERDRCVVEVPAISVLRKNVIKVQWVLEPGAPESEVVFEFRDANPRDGFRPGKGVVLYDDVDYENPTSKKPIWEPEVTLPTVVDRITKFIQPSTTKRRILKTTAYDVHVRFLRNTDKPGKWTDCATLDPIIMNDSN